MMGAGPADKDSAIRYQSGIKPHFDEAYYTGARGRKLSSLLFILIATHSEITLL